MTFAYTPGLKRKEYTTVRKLRRLPILGEVMVKEGEVVTETSIVAKALIPSDPVVLNVALQLNSPAKETNKLINKKEGDTVKKGEIIAERMQYIWFGKKVCKSPINGTVEYISLGAGSVILRGEPNPLSLNAYVPGRVVEILPKEGVIVENQSALIQGIFGIGGETHGIIKMGVTSPEAVLRADQITNDYNGAVIVAGSIIRIQAIKKAVQVGAKAIIVGGIDHLDITQLLGRQIGVAITGNEDVGLTLIITEGFGEMPMARKTFDLLNKHEGKLACLNGATQIRAGVMRPEIIVPLDLDLKATSERDEREDTRTGGMELGTPIRIISEPYFGQLGTVKTLPVDLTTVETESLVRVLEVELEDGTSIMVPRANVELIDE